MDDKSTHQMDEANQVLEALLGRFLAAAVRDQLCCRGRWPAPLMAEMAKGG